MHIPSHPQQSALVLVPQMLWCHHQPDHWSLLLPASQAWHQYFPLDLPTQPANINIYISRLITGMERQEKGKKPQSGTSSEVQQKTFFNTGTYAEAVASNLPPLQLWHHHWRFLVTHTCSPGPHFFPWVQVLHQQDQPTCWHQSAMQKTPTYSHCSICGQRWTGANPASECDMMQTPSNPRRNCRNASNAMLEKSVTCEGKNVWKWVSKDRLP